MSDFIIKKNEEIDNNLLDRITGFDRKVFPLEENYSFPDGYLKRLYDEHKDCFFVMLDEKGNIIGYTNSIFLSDEDMEHYLKTKDYLSLKNQGFQTGDNNLYFFSLVVDEKYRHTDIVKQLMRYFTKWLAEEMKKGKRIKRCISEAITQNGIKTLTKMGMSPQDTDENGLGIYNSPDCLKSYIKEMNDEEPKNKEYNER